MLICLSSCAKRYSEAPIATKFETTEQQKLQAAKHWEIISTEISNSLISDIYSKVGKHERILIEIKDKSTFTKALQWDLIKALTKKGFKVVKHDAKADLSAVKHDVKIEINTDVVEFKKGRKQSGTVGIPSLVTTGLWVIDAMSPSPAGAATLAAYGYDAYNWFDSNRISGETPKSEVIVDLSTSRNDEYLSIIKDIYYVSDSDKHLYYAVDNYKLKQYNIVGSH